MLEKHHSNVLKVLIFSTTLHTLYILTFRLNQIFFDVLTSVKYL